jgi:hypothetical protein
VSINLEKHWLIVLSFPNGADRQRTQLSPSLRKVATNHNYHKSMSIPEHKTTVERAYSNDLRKLDLRMLDLRMLDWWQDDQLLWELPGSALQLSLRWVGGDNNHDHNFKTIPEHEPTVEGHIGMICACGKGGDELHWGMRATEQLLGFPPTAFPSKLRARTATTVTARAYLSMNQRSKGIFKRFEHTGAKRWRRVALRNKGDRTTARLCSYSLSVEVANSNYNNSNSKGIPQHETTVGGHTETICD